jgi:hypothetical protein
MTEPVAWIEPVTKSVINNDKYQRNPFANETGDWIPLYTHPAKTLTAEEITELTPWNKHPYESFVEYTIDDLVDFARAILKKASEK